MPVNSAFSWPLIEPVEAIPTSLPADVLSTLQVLTKSIAIRQGFWVRSLGWKAKSSSTQLMHEITFQNGEDQSIANLCPTQMVNLRLPTPQTVSIF
jgi:hypothetical protein